MDHESLAVVQVNGDFVWETVHNPSAKGKVGKLGESSRKGPGDPGMERTSGRRRGKGDGPQDEKMGSSKGNKWWKRAKKETAQGGVLPTSTADLGEEEAKIGEEKNKGDETERPFELNNLKFVVPKGAFIGIIGRVGCGKVCVLIWRSP